MENMDFLPPASFSRARLTLPDMTPALDSPTRDGRVRGGCAGGKFPLPDSKALINRVLIPFLTPLLGNKGVHIVNGKVMNTKTAGFGLNGKGIRIGSWNINHVFYFV